MVVDTDKWTSTFHTGIESSDPETGTYINITTIKGKKFAVQCGPAQVGAMVGVYGGMAPKTVLPGGCDKTFWTCKHGFYHSYVYDGGWKDRIIDSGILLVKIATSGAVKQTIDLDPVIFSIVKNIQERTDTYERVAVASMWINPAHYDRCLNYEPYLTAASPDYLDLPQSTSVIGVRFLGGDPDDPSNWLRPASYSGILGPVYAGVKAGTDLSLCPWNQMKFPADPANIHVRDIKKDANKNLWVLLQIGWEYSDVWGNKVDHASFPGQECKLAMEYDDKYAYGSYADLTRYPVYDPNYFPRQYRPPTTGTAVETKDRYYRCGLPRARMFLVVFNYATNYKTWDYLPFIPGTRGFKGHYYNDANTRGPCGWTISNPPMKMDVDEFGNIYVNAGTWYGTDNPYYYPDTHWEGRGFSIAEPMYFYQRLDSEMAVGYVKVSEGLDVGRIGPYPSSPRLWSFDFDITAYKGKPYSSFYNIQCQRTPWTHTLGGDGIHLTKNGDNVTTKVASYHLTSFGNRSLSRCKIKIDYSVKRPHPVHNIVSGDPTWVPYNIRNYNTEWLGYTNKELAMEMDLLFAQCDFMTRNYYGTSGTGNVQPASSLMFAFDPASWWEYEEAWRTTSTNGSAQMNLDRTVFFEVGSGDGEVVWGFIPAENPGGWYKHHTQIGGIHYELDCRTYCGKDLRNYPNNRNMVPLIKGCDNIQDQFCRVASTPYGQPGVTGATDYFEKNCMMGGLPMLKSRIANEDVVISPVFDFKHEIFAFTANTWDTFNAVRTRFGYTLTSVAYPWRWHTMQKYITQASADSLDSSNYGVRADFKDPTAPQSGEYVPDDEIKVFLYTDEYQAVITDIQAQWARSEVQTAYAQMMQNVTQIKWMYWETHMRNLNYGSFGCSISCEDSVGLFVPLFIISAAVVEDTPSTYVVEVYYDVYSYKRLYIMKSSQEFDRTFKQGGTKKVKTWWEVFKNWITPATPAEEANPGISIQLFNFGGTQVLDAKGWEPDPDYEYVQEKWQQLSFDNWYPKGTRKSPQFY